MSKKQASPKAQPKAEAKPLNKVEVIFSKAPEANFTIEGAQDLKVLRKKARKSIRNKGTSIKEAEVEATEHTITITFKTFAPPAPEAQDEAEAEAPEEENTEA